MLIIELFVITHHIAYQSVSRTLLLPASCSSMADPLLFHGLCAQEADLAMNSSKGISTCSGPFVHPNVMTTDT